jgi:hypothetical protein
MSGKRASNGRPRDPATGHFQTGATGATTNGATTNGANGHATHAPALPAGGRPAAFGGWPSSGQPPRPPTPASSAPADAPPPAAAAPPPPPAAAAPPAAPPPPPQPEPPRPGPLPADAQAANGYRDRVQQRDARTFGAVSRPFPQSELNLPQVWLEQLRTRRIPPQAMTITVRSVQPQPAYDFWIDGAAVCGAHPDREIFEYIENLRRRPDEHETFVGRIMALDGNTGEPMDLGWGQLYLAPRVPNAAGNWANPQQRGWSQPGAPPPWPAPPPGYGAPPYGAPPSPYGGPPPPPWGGAGPYGYGGPYPYPPTPYGYGAAPWGSPWAGAPGAPPPQTPPPQTNDPAILAMWREANTATAAAQQKHLEFLQSMALQKPNGPPPAAESFSQQMETTFGFMDRMASVMEKWRGPQQESSPSNPVHITTLPGGDTIVAGKDGIDTQMTGLFMAKDMVATGTKRIAEALAKRQVNGTVASGGSASVAQASAGRPPRP